MVANSNGEALPGSSKQGECAIMRLQEFAGMFEEGFALRRKLHVTGCPLDEPAAEPFFEPLQLQADRGLSCPHGFSRPREAVELGDADESLDCVQVEGALVHCRMLSLK